MTVVDDKPLTEEQVRELVIRAGMLLRFRPVPGSDPKQAKLWLQSVAEYLASEALRRVLRQLGVEVPADLAKPVEDQSAVLDHLTQVIDGHDRHDDNPALAVAGLVGLAYLGLVTYAIYWNVTQESSGGENPDAGSPVDGGASG
ncbi:hypothetical protein AB0K00_36210 [Dactylosporangium sp. NPDC049525]|uniref:hypothetical protein n=1 Tax=Dactylosporangium sp. NPDC049525 TaxID=3154730 RepID=UPI00341F4AEC